MHHEHEVHDDDQPVGRILSRREALALLGGAGAALVAAVSLPRLVSAQSATVAPPAGATAVPACIVRPELTEGPYFVETALERVDIRTDADAQIARAGLPLVVVFRVSDVTGGTCAPLSGAQVDVWHCDADGQYSGVQDRNADNRDQLWLRGYQFTDAAGVARFLTIFPGWYSGRAVHIHFKIRTEAGYAFASQFFFEPAQIEAIYAEPPYAARGLPNVPNERDGIFRQSDGALTLTLLALDDDALTEWAVERGYEATFDFGLDLSAEGGTRQA